MMSDLISRQDAIDVFGKLSQGKYYTSLINALPSAEPRWIPVTERMPNTEVLCCDNKGDMIIGIPYADDESYTGYSAAWDDCYMCDCVAWMPLPEPYKAEGEEK